MKKITFLDCDYMEILNKYRTHEDAFIFLDPPYLFSDNSSYSKQRRKEGMDMTEIIYKIYEVFKKRNTRAKIMLIINDMKILRWLFCKYIKGDYKKIYSLSGRTDNHLIICNY